LSEAPRRRKPTLLPGVIDDIRALPTRELRELAVRLCLEIEAGRVVGVPLENLSHTGDLSDCFKVYFDFPRGDRPNYRLVYRKNPDETIVAVAVQIVAVGRREALAVYLEAARRLGR